MGTDPLQGGATIGDIQASGSHPKAAAGENPVGQALAQQPGPVGMKMQIIGGYPCFECGEASALTVCGPPERHYCPIHSPYHFAYAIPPDTVALIAQLQEKVKRLEDETADWYEHVKKRDAELAELRQQYDLIIEDKRDAIAHRVEAERALAGAMAQALSAAADKIADQPEWFEDKTAVRIRMLLRAMASEHEQSAPAEKAVVLSHYDGSTAPTAFLPEYAAQDLTAEMWDKDAQHFAMAREAGAVKIYVGGAQVWPAPVTGKDPIT
jgi:hypothetical protein